MEIGMVVPFAGASAPSGYLLCDGSSYLRSTYSDLFGVIGTVFGAIDGTHFNVPDLRGRGPVGAGQGVGNRSSGSGLPGGLFSNLENLSLGDWLGGFEQVITDYDVPNHLHEITTTPHTHNILGLEHTHPVTNSPHTHIQNAHTHGVPGRGDALPGTGYRYVVADGSGSIQDLNSKPAVATNQEATQNTLVGAGLNNEWITQTEFLIEYTVSQSPSDDPSNQTNMNIRNPSVVLNFLIKA